MRYYDPPRTATEGTIFPNSAQDSTGFQWFEGGIMWGAMFEYMKTLGDQQYVETISQALVLASFGEIASFLGAIPTLAETLQGKWNDDILWWAMGPITGAELFGTEQRMPGGTTYLNLANITYQQTWAQWDDECRGGIYWSRNRNPNTKSRGFKSTITNAQSLYIGSKLAQLTGDRSFIQNAEQMYRWMKTHGIIEPDYHVNDGTDTERNCAIFIDQHSYNSGNTLAGLAVLYNVTGNPFYLTEAHQIARASVGRFSRNGIITDRCEPSCPENQVSFKGSMIRGLGVLHEYTNDAAIRTFIRDTLRTTITAMFRTCDDNLQCGNYWDQGTQVPSNVHYQMNALELITAYTKTFDVGVVIGGQLTAPSKPPPASTTPGGSNSGEGTLKSSIIVGLLSIFGLLL
jgi:mannan endo-1,6-alpha-mannosidase